MHCIYYSLFSDPCAQQVYELLLLYANWPTGGWYGCQIRASSSNPHCINERTGDGVFVGSPAVGADAIGEYGECAAQACKRVFTHALKQTHTSNMRR
jgi:hypothetical protein